MRLRTLPLAGLAAATALTLATAPADAAASRPTSSVEISRIFFDSPGPDYRSPASLNAEYAVITNNSRRSVDLSGWELSDRGGHTFEFDRGTRLAGHGRIVVRTGSGHDGLFQKFWGERNYVWNNDSDMGKLVDSRGRYQDSCSYRVDRRHYRPWVDC